MSQKDDEDAPDSNVFFDNPSSMTTYFKKIASPNKHNESAKKSP